MKNRFLGLLMLGVALFSACSDDDNDKKDGLAGLNGTYSGTSGEYVLDLRYSDSTLLGKSVTVNSADGATATVTLQGVVPGETETVLPDVAFTGAGAEVYSFSAESATDARSLSVEGTISRGRLSLGVDVLFAQNELMATWGLADKSVHLIWEPSDLAFSLDVNGTGEKQDFKVALLQMFLPNILGGMLEDYLQDVTFLPDGNIVATYNAATSEAAEPAWTASPINLAHYAVKDGICYVYPNVEMIMRQAQADQAGQETLSGSATGMLSQLLVGGIPVHYTLEAGELTMFIDTEFVDKFMPLVPLVLQILPEDMVYTVEAPLLGTIHIDIRDILTQLPGIMEQTTRFEFGLVLAAAPQE